MDTFIQQIFNGLVMGSMYQQFQIQLYEGRHSLKNNKGRL